MRPAGRGAWAAYVGAAALAAIALAGCSSSFAQNDRLEKEGLGASKAQQGLSVTKENPDVSVADTASVTDENGTAIVVTLKSRAKDDQVNVPVGVDVVDAKGTSVFKNDTPGLEPSLVEMPVVPPGETDWVNDQVQPSGTPAKVKAEVGLPKAKAPTKLPTLTVSGVKLETDPTSGILASGTVKNDSTVDQTKLVAFGVARDGRKVVAAGRAVLPKLKAGKSGIFRIFFIGDPRKGKLAVHIPPSTFE